MLFIDTETTGLDSDFGCLPFMVGMIEEREPIKGWTDSGKELVKYTTDYSMRFNLVAWDVDPISRIPRYHVSKQGDDHSGLENRWEFMILNPHLETPSMNTRKVGFFPANKHTEVLNTLKKHPVWVFHNSAFDIEMLRSLFASVGNDGSHLREFEALLEERVSEQDGCSIEDTMILSHLWRNDLSNGLKPVAEMLVGIPSDDEKELRKAVMEARTIGEKLDYRIAKRGLPEFGGRTDESWWGFDYWLPRAVAKAGKGKPEWLDICARYCMMDVLRTSFVWRWFQANIKFTDRLREVYRQRIGLAHRCREIQKAGMSMKPKQVYQVSRELDNESRKSADTLRMIAKPFQENGKEFNPNSPTQVVELLRTLSSLEDWSPDERKRPYPFIGTEAKYITGVCEQFFASEKSKTELAIRNLINYRKSSKLSGYIGSYQKWADKGKIHVRMNPCGTRFTRQSSSDPNLQNVPKKLVRRCFGPESGKVWLDFDFSNLELRIWAYKCPSPSLIEVFETGGLVHKMICLEIHPELKKLNLTDEELSATTEYSTTKNGNFSLIYGAGEGTADGTYGFKGAYERLVGRFPEIRQFTQRLHREVSQRGYIETCHGYPLRIPEREPHKAVSGYVQGTAGDIMTRTMNRLKKLYDQRFPQAKMICQIHDEIIVEIDDGNPKLQMSIQQKTKAVMQTVGEEIGVPTPGDCRIISYPETWEKKRK